MRTDQQPASEPDDSGTSSSAGPPAIVVRSGYVHVLRTAAGWSMAELARRARLDQSAVARLLSGDLRPGHRSIAGLLVAFASQFPTIGFYDLFELREADGTILTPVASGPRNADPDDPVPMVRVQGRGAR